jgi:hypothetical protein
MAAVTIDIPGVGNVVAKNAASEATLREILKAMQGVEKKITGKNSGGKGDDGDEDPTAGPMGKMGKLGAAFGKLSASVTPIIGGFSALTNAITGTLSEFAGVGDDIERAAKTIPIFGGLLGTVAAASVKVNDSFLAASKSGATFGGSISQFAGAASAAGMTMDKFGALVARNGEGMLGFGGTTEEGAKRFSQVSKSLRQTSSDLYALGFSTEDINQGLASYGDLLRKQGLQGTKSNTELAAGAQRYMKELDALAKISGEERSVKEAQMKQLATDAQFQMSMAGKSEETRASFMKLIGGFGPTLGGFVKDFVATGTVTTEENARIAAALGGPTMDELNKLRSKLQANQQLSDEEQDRLRNIMKKASDAGSKQLGASLAANRENDAMSKAYIEGMQLQTDAVKKTTDGQKTAAEQGDNFNKRLQESQQKLANFSNGFQMALANSGVLEFTMRVFSGLATLVQTFVVPAFNVLTSIITGVGGFLMDIGSFIGDNLTPLFHGLGVTLTILTAAYAKQIIATLSNTYTTVANSVSKAYNTVVTTLQSVASAIVAAPLIALAVAIGAAVALFVGLYRSGWTFSSAFEAIGDNLKRFGMNLMELIDGIRGKLPAMFGGLSKEEVEAKAKIREAERKELDEREKNRDASREAVKKERGIETEKEKNAKKSNAIDAKIIDDKKAAANASAKINYESGTEELAKQFAKAEGSPLIPKDKQEATAKAETTKKEIEAKGEEKTAADKKAAEERAKSEEKSKEEGKKGKGTAPATQESAESLLASLNTKMEQLIRLSAQTTTNTYEQISATKNLSGNIY